MPFMNNADLEVMYNKDKDMWGVLDHLGTLYETGAKQEAIEWAKRDAIAGDTIAVFKRDGDLDRLFTVENEHSGTEHLEGGWNLF